MHYDIAVIGSGESGIGSALLARHLKLKVLVSDQGPIAEKFKRELQANKIDFEENGHSEEVILQAGLIIKSPGVPEKAPIMQALRARNKRVEGEIEFAFRHLQQPVKIVAITGSNGKTTTTTLTAHVLKIAGMDVRMGGNVGHSFARLVLDQLRSKKPNLHKWSFKQPVFVLELSSFQLDDIITFRPDIGVILNITPDHLDRYDYKMERYVASKFRIAMNMRRTDQLIVNKYDPVILEYLNSDAFLSDCRVHKATVSKYTYPRLSRKGVNIDMRETKLLGTHNAFNAKIAITIAQMLGARDELIMEALMSYNPPPHRMEVVARHRGVTWINDSKATNVDSVFYALQAVTAPVVWIVGGVDKGNDYTPLLPLVKEKVKGIIYMGTDNSKLVSVFGAPTANIKSTDHPRAAITEAIKLATEGTTVILSPACASFDLFKNYEHRGEVFKQEVLTQLQLS